MSVRQSTRASFVAASILVSLLLVASAQARTLIHVGRLIDGTSSEPTSKVTLVVEQMRIIAIEDGFLAPTAEDQWVDLSEYSVLPGLIDLHVHLTSELSRTSYTERTQLEPADAALRASVFARRTLEAGFTTVRDLGDAANVTVSLKRAINSGWIPGPRIYAATKAIGTTGGHADPTNGLNSLLRGNPGPADGVVNSAEDARKAVRQRYKEGADLIKITATGGVLSVARNGQNPQFFEDELQAVVDTARDYGFHVAAHAHGTEGMQRAIRAGVRTIEHGTFMDEETINLMKEHGTYFVPTVSAGNWVAYLAEQEGFLPEVIRPKAAEIGPKISDTLGRAYKAGVSIAFGTDSGVSPHGDNAKEFGFMVEAGVQPADAIRSATSVAAKVLEIDDSYGSIEVGKVADLIAVVGDPLKDITTLENVLFVMKEGQVVKQPD